jgi:hypothetical protein
VIGSPDNDTDDHERERQNHRHHVGNVNLLLSKTLTLGVSHEFFTVIVYDYFTPGQAIRLQITNYLITQLLNYFIRLNTCQKFQKYMPAPSEALAFIRRNSYNYQYDHGREDFLIPYHSPGFGRISGNIDQGLEIDETIHQTSIFKKRNAEENRTGL